MNWPWVSRQRLETALVEAKSALTLGQQHFIESEHLKEEIRALMTTRANLVTMCKQLQARLDDLLSDSPDSKLNTLNLKDALHRISFLQTKAETLERKNSELMEQISTWRGKAEVAQAQ